MTEYSLSITCAHTKFQIDGASTCDVTPGKLHELFQLFHTTYVTVMPQYEATVKLGFQSIS